MESTKIILRDLIAPNFIPIHEAIKNGTHTYFWLKGGRASTKSSFTAIEIVLGITQDPEANAIVFRKVGDTVRNSVHAIMLWAIAKMGIEHYFDVTTSPAEIVFRKTGQRIIFKGTDKPEKLKSIALKKGYFKYAWFEELAEFAGPEEVRNILQSVVRGNVQPRVIMTYNPPDDEYNWVNREATAQVNDRLVHHSTYLDVPPDWLGKQFIKDAESLKLRDYERYAHEYLGEVIGRTDKLVMAGRWSVEKFDTPIHLDGPYFGADWGFANDPNVLVKLWIDWEPMKIYVEYAKYGNGTETDDIPELFECVPGSKDHTIRADSARPETISYLKRHGYPKMVGVKKWPGSVEDGVNYMKNFHWVIHERCEEFIEEAKNWSYKTNRAGDVLSKLDDGFDHGWDGCRYSLTPFIKKRDTEVEIVGPTTTGGSIEDVVLAF